MRVARPSTLPSNLDLLARVDSELKDLRARYERLELLHQVGNAIHSSLDPLEALNLIVSESVRITHASSGSVVLFNPTTRQLEIAASSGLPPGANALKLALGEGITGWVAQHGVCARIDDVRTDPRYIPLHSHVLSELAVPFEVNGEVCGVLNVDSDRVGAFAEGDERLLQDLAVQAAKAIHKTWMYEQLRLKARLFESLIKVGQTISSTLNLNDVLSTITRETAKLMDAKLCSLLLIDDSGEWLELRASAGAGAAYSGKPKLSVEESLLGIVVRRRKPVQVEDVRRSSRYQNREIARQEGLVSLLSAPLVFRDRAIGALNVYSGISHSFSNEEIQVLMLLADLSGIAIEKARLYERIVDAEEELRQSEKLSAIGLLAAEVAHEIRNPLTVIKMLFHSLNLTFPPEDPRAKDVEVMASKMDHLNRIVERVLRFAKNAEPQFGPVNLNELIEELSLLIRHKLNQQQITLSRRLDSMLPPVLADAAQISQVFLNLTLNAIEAMPSGGTLTVVSRSVRFPWNNPVSNGALIQFRDTGQGMTPEHCGKVFTSLLSSTKVKGTGLGLAIVSKIIEAHRGTVRVRSQLGRGTRFSVLLPVSA
ncbi:MAG: GAF domain-containing protein [Verrucomicrobia bacterium]|nr:GAF domain-containing protein [Verrucomicrobiota bacterium]